MHSSLPRQQRPLDTPCAADGTLYKLNKYMFILTKYNNMEKEKECGFKKHIKVLIGNFLRLLGFGGKLYDRGVCDKPIPQDAFKYVEDSENKGLNKEQASKMLNISVRQFDRRIAKGLIKKGRKYRGDKYLYWEKEYIEKMANIM